MATLNLDFYRVEMPDTAGPTTFESLLKKANEKKANERVLDIDGRKIELHALSTSGEKWEGDMVKIRMTNLPSKATLSGEVEDLDLPSNAGLGEHTAFLYHQRLRVLLIQRSRSGVPAAIFNRYFEQIGKLDGPIDLTPIIQANAKDRIRAMQKVKKMRIKLAGIDHKKGLVSDGSSLEGAMKTINLLDAPYAELVFSMGRQEGSLDVPKAVKAALALGTMKEASVIELTGVRSDDERDIIDLLDYCMTEQENAAYDQSQRRIGYASRQAALTNAWKRRVQELEAMYGSKKS